MFVRSMLPVRLYTHLGDCTMLHNIRYLWTCLHYAEPSVPILALVIMPPPSIETVAYSSSISCCADSRSDADRRLRQYVQYSYINVHNEDLRCERVITGSHFPSLAYDNARHCYVDVVANKIASRQSLAKQQIAVL